MPSLTITAILADYQYVSTFQKSHACINFFSLIYHFDKNVNSDQMKDVSLTPFRKTNLTETAFTFSTKEIHERLLSTLPGEDYIDVSHNFLFRLIYLKFPKIPENSHLS